MTVTHDKYVNSLNASRTKFYMCFSSGNLQVNSSVFLNVIVNWKLFNADERNEMVPSYQQIFFLSLDLRKLNLGLLRWIHTVYVYSEKSFISEEWNLPFPLQHLDSWEEAHVRKPRSRHAHTNCRSEKRKCYLQRAMWENTAFARVWMLLCIPI